MKHMDEDRLNEGTDPEKMISDTEINQQTEETVSENGEKIVAEKTAAKTDETAGSNKRDDDIAEGTVNESRYDSLIHQYKMNHEKNISGKDEEMFSTVELLRQAEENWGMQFSGSRIENATFVVHNNPGTNSISKESKKNLLGVLNEKELLHWCSEHYRDMYFSMLLAVCILDRQPYQTIYLMAKELREIFVKSSADSEEEDNGWFFKTDILDTLGLVGYTDNISVRNAAQEVDFLRLPVHEQAEKYIQLMVNEVPELKAALTKYLAGKIISVCKSRRNYMIVSGCIEALTFIAAADLPFFNDHIIPVFLKQKTAEMDFCLSVLLGKLYRKSACKDFVENCVVQWGRLKNNPHCSLTALNVCGLLGKQENLVRDIWIGILDRISDELMIGYPKSGMSYCDNLHDFFQSGNRNLSYYKGAIHAFTIQLKAAEADRAYDRWNFLVTVFLLFLIDDYNSCNVSGTGMKKKDMIWIRIFKKLDSRTGQELTKLWCLALDSRNAPKEVWKLLETYLSEYKDYTEDDIDNLAFFFYHINKGTGDNRALLFLKTCSEKGLHSAGIAGQVYKRIKE